jgi:nucleoside-diphosphate-sugar epimerase
MTILVTGGAGYLGSVCSLLLLESGFRVRVLDNLMYGGESLLALTAHEGFEFVLGDVCDRCTVQAALQGVDAIVHLAAIVGDPACARQPSHAMAVNQRASLDVIVAAREENVRRFLFASTCSNYGRMKDTSEPATETGELRPVSLYAETKVAVERALLDGHMGQTSATVLRFATLYGLSSRMRFDLTVNEFVMRTLIERKLVVYGEQFWRPYVHVRDAASAIAIVLAAPVETVSGKVFNVGDTKENYRKIDLVDMVKKRVGNVLIEYVHKTEDPRDYRVSFEAIRRCLGYRITRRVEDGIVEIAKAIESGMLQQPGDPRYYN